MTITAKTAVAVSIATVISASCFTANRITALVQTPNYEYADEIEECFNLVNEARTEECSPEIEISYELNYLADVRAKEQTELFSHTRPDDTRWVTVFDEYGVSAGYKGENILYGSTTAQGAMDLWLNSEGHRANILNTNYTHVGIGVAVGDDGRTYWVQLFASDLSLENSEIPEYTEPEIPEKVYGDVNEDGTVNVSDLFLVAQYVSEQISELPNMDNGDMNDDGEVNIMDLMNLATLIISE